MLSIELVPRTCWGSNVRSLVTTAEWNRIRKASYANAGHRCEVCGGVGNQHPVDCHEVWDYDDATHTQRLVRMIALCPACHEVKHYGRATRNGRGPQAQAHLATVNRWSGAQVRAHVEEAKALHAARSEHDWSLDLTVLSAYGVSAGILAPADRPRGDPTDRI